LKPQLKASGCEWLLAAVAASLVFALGSLVNT